MDDESKGIEGWMKHEQTPGGWGRNGYRWKKGSSLKGMDKYFLKKNKARIVGQNNSHTHTIQRE